MLKPNLLRQGVDLSIETDLLYVDVNNKRIGINKTVPNSEFDLAGVAIFNDNLQISGTTVSSLNTNGNIAIELDGSGTLNISSLTSGRVVFVGADGALVDSANFVFDGNNLTVSDGVTANTADIGNLEIENNTVSASNTNGNIILDPTGTGTVNVSTLTEGRVVFVGADGALVDNSNLSFDGVDLFVGGNTVLNTAQLGNLSVDGNTIESVNTNGNIILDPAGVGNVIVESATPGRVFYSGINRELLTNNSLTYDGTVFAVDNISVQSNTISSINTNGDINVSLNGSGQLVIQGNNAVTVPSGTTLQRPSGNVGDIRVNSDTGNFEFYNGTEWQVLSPSGSISTIDLFDGDGSTVQFTLSESTTVTGSIVTLNGVVQSTSTAYNITGTTLTFTEAPKSGDDIEVRYINDTFSVGSIIEDGDSSVRVDDSNANIVSKINGSNVVVTTSSSTTFSGTISGTGSISSIKTSVPSSNSDTGVKGEIAYDANYVYICVDTDTWIRSSIENSF